MNSRARASRGRCAWVEAVEAIVGAKSGAADGEGERGEDGVEAGQGINDEGSRSRIVGKDRRGLWRSASVRYSVSSAPVAKYGRETTRKPRCSRRKSRSCVLPVLPPPDEVKCEGPSTSTAVFDWPSCALSFSFSGRAMSMLKKPSAPRAQDVGPCPAEPRTLSSGAVDTVGCCASLRCTSSTGSCVLQPRACPVR